MNNNIVYVIIHMNTSNHNVLFGINLSTGSEKQI